MERFPNPNPPNGTGGSGGVDGHHAHPSDEWAETLARTVAHLAAQLTLAQIRLRALASELQERAAVDPEAVASRVRAIAGEEGGGYLRENLGEALVEMIDVEALERELVAYLEETGGT
jgi:hypothetical protein